jgi:hypothetical protein
MDTWPLHLEGCVKRASVSSAHGSGETVAKALQALLYAVCVDRAVPDDEAGARLTPDRESCHVVHSHIVSRGSSEDTLQFFD